MAYRRTGKPNGRPRVDWTLRDPIIFRALSSGCSYRDAAEWAGVSWPSLWRRRDVDPDFAAGLSRARTVYKVRCLTIITEAASIDWHAAAWLLAHHPEYGAEWGSRADRAPLDDALPIAVIARRVDPEERKHIAAAIALSTGKRGRIRPQGAL